jgi:hypothetical protein
MLRQVETPFPYPGSIALFQGLRWRVHQHVGSQAVISREGIATCLTRRAPINDLVDPTEADANTLISLTDVSEATARITLYTAALLRDTNEVALHDLGGRLYTAAQEGRIPLYSDNSHLVRVMKRLGWRKVGYTGDGLARSPLYRRVSEAEATDAQAA